MKRSKPKWRIGDPVTVGDVRWIIRLIIRDHVELEAANTTNHGIWWKTTLSNLPEKTA
jgi:hypothetical protein